MKLSKGMKVVVTYTKTGDTYEGKVGDGGECVSWRNKVGFTDFRFLYKEDVDDGKWESNMFDYVFTLPDVDVWSRKGEPTRCLLQQADGQWFGLSLPTVMNNPEGAQRGAIVGGMYIVRDKIRTIKGRKIGTIKNGKYEARPMSNTDRIRKYYGTMTAGEKQYMANKLLKADKVVAQRVKRFVPPEMIAQPVPTLPIGTMIYVHTLRPAGIHKVTGFARVESVDNEDPNLPNRVIMLKTGVGGWVANDQWDIVPSE